MEADKRFQRGQPSLAPTHKPRRGARKWWRDAQRGHLGRCHQATLRHVDEGWGAVQGRGPLRAKQHSARTGLADRVSLGTGPSAEAERTPKAYSTRKAPSYKHVECPHPPLLLAQQQLSWLLRHCGYPIRRASARLPAAQPIAAALLKPSAGAAKHLVDRLSLRLHSKLLGSATTRYPPTSTVTDRTYATHARGTLFIKFLLHCCTPHPASCCLAPVNP